MPRKLKCTCGTCRTCKHRDYMRDYLRRNPEKNDKSRWRAANAEAHKATARELRAKVPLRVKRAQDTVQRALKRGELERPNACQRCKAKVKPVAHHADYDNPLEVEWLCRRCHGREHSSYA